jgi:hypothetical protein
VLKGIKREKNSKPKRNIRENNTGGEEGGRKVSYLLQGLVRHSLKRARVPSWFY